MDASPNTRMSSLATGLLWAGVAVSVAEIWAGQYLGEAGLAWGLTINVSGHILGCLVLAGAGCIGTRYRLMSMQSTRLVLGNRGSVIPSLLNLLQLVGWATIMLALSGKIGADVGAAFGGVFARREFWILIIGAGTLCWSLIVGDSRLKWVHNGVIAGLLALSVLLTVVALDPSRYKLTGPFLKPLSPGRGLYLLDVVIAMPISWAPLIADYSRLARSEKGAFRGAFIGYGIVSTWMYAIGLVVFLATGNDDPAANVIGMMAGIGMAIPAMLLVFASTVTSDFPDIYSSACSLLNIDRRIKPTYTIWGTGILTILLALKFDLSRYEDFLILIGALFIPLFSLLLTDYFLVRRQRLEGLDFNDGRGLEFTGGFRLAGLAVWGIGAATYFAARNVPFLPGGSITSFAVTAALHLAVVRLRAGTAPATKA